MFPSGPGEQNITGAATAYARERGGDARRLVVASARVRALAEKWGVGRLLEPAAIRALLDQKTAVGDEDTAGTLKCRTAVQTCTTRHGTETVWKRYGNRRESVVRDWITM